MVRPGSNALVDQAATPAAVVLVAKVDLVRGVTVAATVEQSPR